MRAFLAALVRARTLVLEKPNASGDLAIRVEFEDSRAAAAVIGHGGIVAFRADGDMAGTRADCRAFVQFRQSTCLGVDGKSEHSPSILAASFANGIQILAVRVNSEKTRACYFGCQLRFGQLAGCTIELRTINAFAAGLIGVRSKVHPAIGGGDACGSG